MNVITKLLVKYAKISSNEPFVPYCIITPKLALPAICYICMYLYTYIQELLGTWFG